MRSLRLLVVALAAIFLTACIPPEGGPTEEDVAGFWVLVDGTLMEADIGLVPDHDVTLRLDADGNLGGTSACNSYFGTFDLVAGIFELGAEIGMTAMECAGPVGQTEEAFFRALRLVDSAAVTDDGRLHLVGEQADLLFESAPDPGPQPPG